MVEELKGEGLNKKFSQDNKNLEGMGASIVFTHRGECDADNVKAVYTSFMNFIDNFQLDETQAFFVSLGEEGGVDRSFGDWFEHVHHESYLTAL